MDGKVQKIGKRIKRYFTDKPKGDFWMWAFIYVVIFRYVSPLILIFLTFFMIGLVAPESDISPTIEKVTQTLSEGLMGAGELLFEAGQNIAINNPIISKILFFAFGNFIWIIYIGIFTMIIHSLRYLISWIIKKSPSNTPKQNKTTKEKNN